MASPLLPDEEIDRRLAPLQWSREGDEIIRRWTFADFRAAMAFVNSVADLAEERNHHPDIAISWNKVTLRLTTHDAGGLTELDLELAAALDALQPPPR